MNVFISGLINLISTNSFKKWENKACGLGGNRSLLSVNEDLRLTA